MALLQVLLLAARWLLHLLLSALLLSHLRLWLAALLRRTLLRTLLRWQWRLVVPLGPLGR